MDTFIGAEESIIQAYMAALLLFALIFVIAVVL